MSCHVMSCRHYCIEFLKKSFSKTFLFLKIIYKYFAGFFACAHTICSDYKNFQFDKFQRFFSVIYKKIHLKGDLHHVKSKTQCL